MFDDRSCCPRDLRQEASESQELVPAPKPFFDESWDGASEPRDGRDGMKSFTSKTEGDSATWSVGAGGLGKQT